MTVARRADVIVVGAGVLGTFHAYFAARRGLRVLLLERNALPSAASVRNFGMLPRTIVEPEGEWAGYALASAEIYRTIQEECDISLRETGSLYLASTDLECAVLDEFAQRFGEAFGCVAVKAAEVRSHLPFVRESYCRGGLYFPADLGIDPRHMLRQFIPYMTETHPVEYVPHTPITAVETSGAGCCVRDSAGNHYQAEHVIVCSGADVRTLFPDHFRSSGLQVCKLQMMRTVPLPETRIFHSILSGLSIRRYPAFRSCPTFPELEREAVDEELRDYGIHLLLKQSDDGSIVIGDSHQYCGLDEIAPLEERTECAINEAILRYARTMVELPSWEIAQLWNGYYLVHPERLVHDEPLGGRVYIVTGIAGKGMTTGPGYARESIERILG